MSSTKEHILQIAQKFAKQQGFNGFSYRDIAQQIGIKTAAIHYHFPTKDVLAIALIENYTLELQNFLKEASVSIPKGYDRFVVAFEKIKQIPSSENNFCLCGMLVAEIYTLSPAAKSKLESFFVLFEQWAQSTLSYGIADGSIAKYLDPKQEALLILALIEGAMLINRVRPNALAEALAAVLKKLQP